MKQNWNERCPWNLCWKNTNCFILVSSSKDFSKYPCSQVSYFHVFYQFFSFSGVFSFRCCRYFSVFSYTLDCRMGKSCSTINSQPSPTIADFGWSRLFICSLNKLPNNASPREASRSTVTHQVSKVFCCPTGSLDPRAMSLPLLVAAWPPQSYPPTPSTQ